MTSIKKSFLRALAGEVVDPPPVWLMRQAGRHLSEYKELRATTKSFLDFCYSPEKAIEATLQPVRRYAMDAAILFSDILVIPDALGMDVTFVPGVGPKLKPLEPGDPAPVFDAEKFHHHLDPVYQAVNGLSAKLDDTVTLIGFAGAPWTVATYMVEGGGSKDYLKTRTWAYREPDRFQALIDVLVVATSSYLIRQIDNGAEVVQLFDSWAGILPPNQFARWTTAPIKAITKAVKAAHPNTPVIGFPRGAGLLYKSFVEETGVDGVSLDATVPLDWAAREIQPLCTVQGNLDNLALLTGGQTMDDEIRRVLDAFKNGPFIFNLGHGVLPETPVAHVERLVALVRGEK